MERLDDYFDERLWDLAEVLGELNKSTRGANRALVRTAHDLVWAMRDELEGWGWLIGDERAKDAA